MLKEFFGYSAGFMASIMYIPQIKKMYLTKSTHDISINMIFLLLLCSTLWVIYGLYLNELPVILCDSIVFLEIITMLSLKIYYEKLYCCRNRTNSIDQVITTST